MNVACLRHGSVKSARRCACGNNTSAPADTCKRSHTPPHPRWKSAFQRVMLLRGRRRQGHARDSPEVYPGGRARPVLAAVRSAHAAARLRAPRSASTRPASTACSPRSCSITSTSQPSGRCSPRCSACCRPGAAGAAGLRRGTRAGPRSARAVSAEALGARGGDGPRVAAAGRLRRRAWGRARVELVRAAGALSGQTSRGRGVLKASRRAARSPVDRHRRLRAERARA